MEWGFAAPLVSRVNVSEVEWNNDTSARSTWSRLWRSLPSALCTRRVPQDCPSRTAKWEQLDGRPCRRLQSIEPQLLGTLNAAAAGTTDNAALASPTRSLLAMAAAELRRLVEALWSRLCGMLQSAPPGTLQVTGVLGLAAVLVGYYHLRGSGGSSTGAAPGAARNIRTDGSSHSSGAAGTSGTAAARQQQHQARGQAAAAAAQVPAVALTAAAHRKAGSAAAGSRGGAAGAAAAGAALTPLARAVRSTLTGVRRLTVSVPGVMLSEWTPAELEGGATLREGAAPLLAEMAAVCDLYLLAHVGDDVGQAAVGGALEAAGVLGRGPRQVAPHRLLFCSTLAGKVSLVRQLEPDLHMDGAAPTVLELSRFMPQLLLVSPSGIAPTPAPNVGVASSLQAFFGVNSTCA